MNLIPQRRRELASSLSFPAELSEAFGKFSTSRLAVLKIICGEVVRHGACTLSKDDIADRASVDVGVVKIALRTAKAEGLIKSERGRTGPNIITLSPTWKAWLDRNGDAPPDREAPGCGEGGG